MTILSCRGLAVGYEGEKVAEGFTFSVEEGDYLCIVGENGAGKSTLVKTLLRLIPPLEGELLTEGIRRNEIGYLPQQTPVQRDFPASVDEIVLSGFLNRPGLRPFYSAEEKKLARENMKKLGIAELSARSYRKLSGGQQQRVLLARALCASGRLLLLDEPTAGLDPRATAELYTLVDELNKKDGVTILTVTHDMAAALRYADRILYVGERPRFFKSAEEYRRSGLAAEMTGGPTEKGGSEK
ncbi:MAG: ABC transporter ATP-binding protein [Bacteroides sp.]|nr:ABC transporter ATP-binding protein [Eubacterium sp.]MCM1418878.1 ABC transporter ATP-binding protein [Roseburia sp.]MCM1463343.1 ABC transporter ATP-binding protein [Bacteroides sp.]